MIIIIVHFYPRPNITDLKSVFSLNERLDYYPDPNARYPVLQEGPLECVELSCLNSVGTPLQLKHEHGTMIHPVAVPKPSHSFRAIIVWV